MHVHDHAEQEARAPGGLPQSVRERVGISWSLTTYQQKLLINILALILLSAIMALLHGRFLTQANISNVLRTVAPVIIVSSAFTLLMVSRMLDLSVGSTLALSGCVAALMASSHVPVPVAFLIGTLTGTLVGIVNAVLVLPFGINSVIATIGMLYIVRGSVQLLTGGVAVYGVPEDYTTFGNGDILGLPNPIWVLLGAVAVFYFLERFTLVGRYSVAVGSNPEASRLSGVPGRQIQALLFVLTGTMAGLAGVLLSSRLRSGQVNVGVGFEFDVIVATVLGGTILAGGEGTVVGTVIGALIVGVLKNGLNLLGVPAFWQTVAQGAVLVLAVSLDVVLRQRLAERRRRAEMTRLRQIG
jgi:ribose/xylose/arabinose/galactoside ABC-type transport system permease subunit